MHSFTSGHKLNNNQIKKNMYEKQLQAGFEPLTLSVEKKPHSFLDSAHFTTVVLRLSMAKSSTIVNHEFVSELDLYTILLAFPLYNIAICATRIKIKKYILTIDFGKNCLTSLVNLEVRHGLGRRRRHRVHPRLRVLVGYAHLEMGVK